MKGLVPPQLISQQSMWSGSDDTVQLGIGENSDPEGSEYVVWRRTQPRHGDGVELEVILSTGSVDDAVDAYNLAAEGLTVYGYRTTGAVYMTVDAMLSSRP